MGGMMDNRERFADVANRIAPLIDDYDGLAKTDPPLWLETIADKLESQQAEINQFGEMLVGVDKQLQLLLRMFEELLAEWEEQVAVVSSKDIKDMCTYTFIAPMRRILTTVAARKGS